MDIHGEAWGDQLKELYAVHSIKERSRTMQEYDGEIMGGAPSDVPPFIAERTDGANSITRILQYMGRTSLDGAVHWADMPGGRGHALRQAAAQLEGQLDLQTTNVDLFEWPPITKGLHPHQKTHLKGLDYTNPRYAPRYVAADVGTVKLEQAADLITMVYGLQYLHDPLHSIANAYNQLKPDGLLLIAGTMPDMYYDSGPIRASSPFDDFLSELDRKRIAYATARFLPVSAYPINRLAISRIGDTVMHLNAAVESVRVNNLDNKDTTYEFGSVSLELQ